MRILLATRWKPFGTAESVKFALEACGHSVRVHDYGRNPVVRWVRKVRFVARDTVAPPLVFRLGIRDPNLRREVEFWEPDMLLALKGETIHPDDLDWARKRGVVTVNWFPDDPQLFRAVSRHVVSHYDFYFTNSVQTLDWYRKLGCANVRWIACGCEPRFQRPLPMEEIGEEYQSDVCFVGSWIPERTGFVDALSGLRGVRVKVWGQKWEKLRDRKGWEHISFGSQLSWNDQMVQAYNGAAVVLNTTNRVQFGHDVNAKVYEILACGAFLLTNEASSLNRVFDEGVEVATYRDYGDLGDLVMHYLGREEKRLRISRAGRARAIRDHTVLHRVQEILLVAAGEKPSVTAEEAYGGLVLR